MMEGWMLLWKIVFIVGIAIFTGMAVWVIIGGFSDIKSMLSTIKRQHETREDEEKEI